MAANEAPDSLSQQPKVIYNVVGRAVKKRTAKEASGWVYSPGNLQFLKEGERLVGLVGVNGVPLKQVDYIRAAMVKNSSILFVYPTTDKDPNAVAVSRTSKRVTANLSDFLLAQGQALAVNTMSRFRMVLSTPEDPVYPAVVLDLSAPVETKLINKKKYRKSKQTSQAGSGQKQDGSAAG